VGIRGKILEAWAMTIPVVATTLACAGLRYRDGENLMVADNSEGFASRIVDLLKDRDLRERIGREGRKVAEQFYGWETIASQLDQLYQDYMRPRGAGH
jgi:glycosyltransferase involved in cell wall biosynthesis